MTRDKACIVGAGSSGLACVKILKQRGVPFDCFEMGSDVGGNWRYENDNGVSSAYRSLHINTSKQKMAYSDFPMPEDFPDFPHHTQVLAYFEDYVEHFGLRRPITFETEVMLVEPASDEGYRVTVRGRDGQERTERYGAVLVANGHHWCPRWPDFPGEFNGRVLHSHDYTTPEIFDGRRALVVGVGNSGCDVVCEAARRGEATYLSTRRGAHVVPKYILGRPLGHWSSKATSYLPLWLQRIVFRLLLLVSRGRQGSYGFPTPEYPFGAEHPTVSSDLLNLVGHGRIEVKPDVDRLQGDRVRFADGSVEEIDVVVFATGYRVSFPFFDDDFLAAPDNELALYHRVAHPDFPLLHRADPAPGRHDAFGGSPGGVGGRPAGGKGWAARAGANAAGDEAGTRRGTGTLRGFSPPHHADRFLPLLENDRERAPAGDAHHARPWARPPPELLDPQAPDRPGPGRISRR